MEQSISGKTKPGESPGGIVATPGDNVDLDMRGATTETPDEDMADKSSSSGESSDCDSLPDLAGIEARHLRRASNHDAKTVERQGLVYTDMYRQLQLKPQKYLEFYNGVLWPLRYNHLEEIQRGTPAGYKAFTNRLLRGYGYIIWPDGPSEWLMDEADLDEGEVRLKYVKPSGRAGASTVPENARFCTIFDAFWTRMRNAIFTRRTQTTAPSHRRVGGRVRRNSNKGGPKTHQRSSPVNNDNESDENDNRAALPPPTPFERARGRSQQRIVDLQARMAEVSPPGRHPMLTYGELDQALIRLTVDLSTIRARSDANMFASLWEEKIMRLDEIESELPEDPVLVEMINNAIARGDMPAPPEGPPPVLCNEPFNTRGNPVRDPNSNIPPTIPSTMSIWINTLYLPVVTLTEADITAGVGSFAQSSGSYHWVDAPVEEVDMNRFIEGVNLRIAPTPSKIMGYVLCYGWNDTSRFLSTGQFETYGRIKTTERMNEDTSAATVAGPSTATAAPRGGDTDFPLHQWSVIRPGWADFRNDLVRASLDGVKIWRMRVCVVALP
ncbi:hypothetical protein RBB50_012120 [Rhinocladiella similis]